MYLCCLDLITDSTYIGTEDLLRQVFKTRLYSSLSPQSWRRRFTFTFAATNWRH